MTSAVTSTIPATVTTMVICVPDEVPTALLTGGSLQHVLGVQGQTARRFWTQHKVPLWKRHHLVDVLKGQRGWCAGGPKGLLDLDATGHSAALAAGMRHRQWAGVVKGTKEAKPWHTFAAAHTADPAKFPLDRARRVFEAQPRVQAMRMHNAANFTGTAGHLDIGELEILQHGSVTYQNYHYLHSVCADTILTGNGRQFAPASDAVADRRSFLEQARRFLDGLPDTTRLLAITV